MKRILMAAAIATAFTAFPTMAATFSSASLSNYNVSLVDLDLEDGITPSITFKPVNNGSYLGGGTISGTRHGSPLYQSFYRSLSVIGPASEMINSITTNASASISGDSFYNRSLEVSGGSLGAGAIGTNDEYYSVIAETLSYTLTANTQLNITADALKYAEHTVGKAAREYAHSRISMFTSGAAINVYGEPYGYDSYNIYDPNTFDSIYYDNDTAFNLSQLMLYSLSVKNRYTDQFTGYLTSIIEVKGASSERTSLTAVPVPAALPLMASAVGLFGLGAKRRKALKA